MEEQIIGLLRDHKAEAKAADLKRKLDDFDAKGLEVEMPD